MSKKIFFSLSHLPYGKKAFGKEFLTKESFDYHYDKHHASYVNNLNILLEDEESLHKYKVLLTKSSGFPYLPMGV